MFLKSIQMIYSCFASTNRGLEELLALEATKFSVKNIEVLKSGIKFRANLEQIMQFNLHSRVASRIMIEVGHSYYSNEADIYDMAYEISWDSWFAPGDTIKVDTNAISSPLKSLEFVNLKVKDAICDKFVQVCSCRPDVNKYTPDIRVYNFLTENTITIYLDTSGESLFKRGYRHNKLEAPLKENLAAGLVLLSNWQFEETLFDPMCGSGTIAIEAVCMGLNIAPGLKRHFAFEKFKNHDKSKWQNLKTAAMEQINYTNKLDIYANDIDKNAINALEDNCRNLGVLHQINYRKANFLECAAPNSSGILITNPPYGIRLDELESMGDSYPQYASHLKKYYSNWNCHFLTADLRMPKLMRLKPNRKIPLYNGALECRLFEFRMVAGSNR